MTYPGPTTRRRLLLGHTERDMLELEARRGVHAGMLASNKNRADYIDGVTGAHAPVEQQVRGWTAQQPWTHVDCDVMHVCILCAKLVDPDYLRDHHCRVARELETVA